MTDGIAIIERVHKRGASVKAAEAKGTRFGRKPKLTAHQQSPKAPGRRRELSIDR